MKKVDQEKWLNWFSRLGFISPIIYLMRAKQYIHLLGLLVIIIVIPLIIDGGAIISFITIIWLRIFLWIKWKKIAYEEHQKDFNRFKKSYEKASKIIIGITILFLIVTILASVLIPRISQVRQRANDTARKAHLQQVAAVLVAHQIDKWSYPATPGPLSDIEEELLDAGLSSVPTDPDPTNTLGLYTTGINIYTWQYFYFPMVRKNKKNWWFVLVAKTQTQGWSNRVLEDSYKIENIKSIEEIFECDKLIKSTKAKNTKNGICYYKNENDLAYIYIQ